ncbi:hypothetical protein BRN31_21985 [Xanthomonas oryzae pv. oryzae]|nr:hypothetical protein BRN91_21385 [Xanthomonas oryzae pv. oryzae]RBL22163.1 hypothetical protein BRN31_21985 [Xanthomonas oryzae pv. oryzae]RBL52602.1 hypothetical protein BRN24_20605 [Xanthomonas oryzae pv. oryzae]
MTWATPFGSEVAQVRSPGSLHNRWCCDPELKPPRVFFRRTVRWFLRDRCWNRIQASANIAEP